ncbi:hypothetical protein [Microbacterium sp. NPDC057650]
METQQSLEEEIAALRRDAGDATALQTKLERKIGKLAGEVLAG